MKITYEKFEDHYVFSHKPKTRVYLGEASPEDYIEDELNQNKRSASAWYKEIHTGKVITFKDVLEYNHDGSKPGNGYVWYGGLDDEFGRRENHTFEGGHTFEFQHKLRMSSLGNMSTKVGVEYPSGNKAMERLAMSHYFGQTLEEYDAQQEKYRLEREETKRKYPLMHNLIMMAGETYYVNDAGERITPDEHIEIMKAGGYL